MALSLNIAPVMHVRIVLGYNNDNLKFNLMLLQLLYIDIAKLKYPFHEYCIQMNMLLKRVYYKVTRMYMLYYFSPSLDALLYAHTCTYFSTRYNFPKCSVMLVMLHTSSFENISPVQMMSRFLLYLPFPGLLL